MLAPAPANIYHDGGSRRVATRAGRWPARACERCRDRQRLVVKHVPLCHRAAAAAFSA
jgi:hypothetical protein